MDLTELVLSLLISAIVTVVVYLFVPLVIIISRKKFRKKTIRMIIIFNGIGGFLLFTVFYALIGNESGANVAPALLWSSIANLILKKTSCIDEEEIEENSEKKTEEIVEIKEDKIVFCRNCGEKLGKDSAFCRICGTKIIKTSNSQKEKIEQNEFCKKCGADVSGDTDVCHVCGEKVVK